MGIRAHSAGGYGNRGGHGYRRQSIIKEGKRADCYLFLDGVFVALDDHDLRHHIRVEGALFVDNTRNFCGFHGVDKVVDDVCDDFLRGGGVDGGAGLDHGHVSDDV